MKITIIISSLLILAKVHSFAFQVSEKDSLLQLINSEKDEKNLADLYSELSWVIYEQERDPAIKYIKESIRLCEKINYIAGLANAYNKIGIYEKDQGNYDLALKYYKQALNLLAKTRDSLEMTMLYSNMGNVYKSKGDYKEALNCFISSLKIAEAINKASCIADALLNLGLMYDHLGNDSIALENLNRSLEFARKNNDPFQITRALKNIANILSEGDQRSKEKALEYYRQALEVDLKYGSLGGQSTCYNNIGAVYAERGEWTKAEEYYLKSLGIKEKLKDKRGKSIVYENLAFVEQNKKDYKKAAGYFEISMALADSIGDANQKIDIMKAIADNYYLMGEYKKSSEVFAELYAYKDSIFNSDMSAQITEMQSKYESEKKDLEIQGLQKDKKLNEQEITRQKMVKNFMTGIAILILLFLAGSIYAFISKRKANRILAKKNEEIMQQKEEITSQRDEIAAQRDLATQQRDIIAHQQKDIKDSIRYAFQIQTALFPTDEDLRLILKDYFIFYRPRDIVSGDFYWVNKTGSRIIIVASDCTGHGVPGAFMSMLGIAFLNEIVNKENITNPAQILNRLRENIILAMKQHGENVKQQDGMDSVAVTIDRQALTLEFAGANNPLYIVSSHQSAVHSQQFSPNNNTDCRPETADFRLTEIKGDKMPVAIYTRMHPFTNHKIDISPGDLVYIFSDGYADQFGGPEGKKFKYKSLKDLLISNRMLPMNEQKKILAGKFDEWKGELPQIDDVLILGIKI